MPNKKPKRKSALDVEDSLTKTVSKSGWSRTECLRFTEIVQGYEILWKKTDVAYRDIHKKELAWNAVASEMSPSYSRSGMLTKARRDLV